MELCFKHTGISLMALLIAAAISICVAPQAFATTPADSASQLEVSATAQEPYAFTVQSDGTWLTEEIELDGLDETFALAAGQDGFSLVDADGSEITSVEDGQRFKIMYSGANQFDSVFELLFKGEDEDDDALMTLSFSPPSVDGDDAATQSDENSAENDESVDMTETGSPEDEPDSTTVTEVKENADSSSTSSSSDSSSTSKKSDASEDSTSKDSSSGSSSQTRSSSSESESRSHNHTSSSSSHSRESNKAAHHSSHSSRSNSHTHSKSHGATGSANSSSETESQSSRSHSGKQQSRDGKGQSDAEAMEAAAETQQAELDETGSSGDDVNVAPVTAISTAIAALGAAGALILKRP